MFFTVYEVSRMAQKYREQFIIDNFKWKSTKINCMPDFFSLSAFLLFE